MSRNQVQQLEVELPTLLEALQVDVLLDVPCGDFSWMQFVNLPVLLYIGADIITELIAENQKRYGSQHRKFITLDLTVEPLPTAKVLLCRDCLVHFSFADIHRTLDNIKRSGIAYLLTTTFPDSEENEDITTGDWRLLNLEKPPFNFPKPLQILNEQCSEGGGQFQDKSLGLWRVQDIHT
ncbi:MAG TPA: class I SAM-dependent methyltransferase [Allocoleopsis sp.]